jgi:hypothetical protein
MRVGLYHCYQNCEVGTCDYGDAEGFCVDVSSGAGTGVCISDTMGTSDCTNGTEGCTTEYDTSSNTVCI